MNQKLLDQTLRYLSLRPRSVREVRSKLKQLGATPPELEETVAYLSELRYLNDRALAEQMVSFRAQHRGWGPTRVERDLMRRGIDGTIAGLVLAEVYSEDKEEELLAGAIEKWTLKRGAPRTQQALKSLFDRLRRNGFRPSQIRRRLSGLFSDVDWDDHS